MPIVEDCILMQRFHLLPFLVDLMVQSLSKAPQNISPHRISVKNFGSGILHLKQNTMYEKVHMLSS